jgi:hypothetical protein
MLRQLHRIAEGGEQHVQYGIYTEHGKKEKHKAHREILQPIAYIFMI